MPQSGQQTPDLKQQIRTGLSILYQPSDREPTVDVIAVHGIGAHADRTWETNGVNWLRHQDMLPAAIPQARILRFAYESQWIGQDNIDQHPAAITNHLLDQIGSSRSHSPTRPLVFISHCFGGILVQRAIIAARLHSPRWTVLSQTDKQSSRDLVDCIAGLIFLGTPFRGSQAQTYAEIIGNILAHFNRGNSTIYDWTKIKSPEQKSQLNDFVQIINYQHIPICCFYEQHKASISRVVLRIKVPGTNEVVVDEDSATIDGISSLPLAANHFNMHKYSGPEDANFQTVLPQLKKMIDEAPARVEARLYNQSWLQVPKTTKSSSKSKTLKLLRVDHPYDDKLAFQKQLDEDSREMGSKIFSDGDYTKWKNSDDESMLWIHGADGLGKTPLTISLIEDLTNRVERSSKKRALAYCFCLTSDGLQKNATTVVRAILYQILLQQPEERPETLDPLRDAYREHDEALLSPRHLLDLWDVLLRTLSVAQIEVAYFLLFRPEESDASILDSLPTLMNHSSETQCFIKWIIISRLDPSDFRQIRTPQQIDLAVVAVEEPSSSEIVSSNDAQDLTCSPLPEPAIGRTESPDANSVDNLLTVSCGQMINHWICTFSIKHDDFMEIKATRLDKKGILLAQGSPGTIVIPHTETGASPDRRLAVTFITPLNVTLQSDRNQLTVRERPVFRFQDPEVFQDFQEQVYRSHLMRLFNTMSIVSNRDRESSRQDLRLWSDGTGDVKLTFYANARRSLPRAYMEIKAFEFEPLDFRSYQSKENSVRLKFRQASGDTRGFSKLNRIFGHSATVEGQLKYIVITFATHADREEFVAILPSFATTT